MHSHSRIYYSLLILFVGLLLVPDVYGGDKLDMIHRNAGKVKKGTLLVAPILPDPFVVKKLKNRAGKPNWTCTWNG